MLLNNQNAKVHREVFFLVNGYYPSVVRHRCDNIKCIEPEHLEGGTPIDNMKDRHQRGRTHNQVSESMKFKIAELRKDGYKYKKIAEILNLKH